MAISIHQIQAESRIMLFTSIPEIVLIFNKRRLNTNPRCNMIREIEVSLKMSEIAAISQRALAEKMASVHDGVWQQLWRKIEGEIERVERKPVKAK